MNIREFARANIHIQDACTPVSYTLVTKKEKNAYRTSLTIIARNRTGAVIPAGEVYIRPIYLYDGAVSYERKPLKYISLETMTGQDLTIDLP
ncbi:hypothetical protein Q5741_19795 [Paenibacillus sp. JX-17]|uniref:Uncharacterized protein n=1 Tax=Paenibacillus lacisoli TaxID=3064525 RepID=A0ABT9CID6_9BACL|nr:hypothetical protein [Paenibacillus sp. JX-17]MDO7908635.1 hypothetical protein [Paenibacillus sp. JX-17]